MEQLDVLQHILSYLTVGQISLSCPISSTFNIVCRRESLWKNKCWTDYKVSKKIRLDATWRETSKEIFEESESFWLSVEQGISYHMTLGVTYSRTSQLVVDVGYDKVDDCINGFEIDLANRALREREEFYVAELIFRSFYHTSRYLDSIYEDIYYINFIGLFRRIAELSVKDMRIFSSRGKLSPLVNLSSDMKISLKWILSLNHISEVKSIDDPSMTNFGRCETARLANEKLHTSLVSLASLYVKHRDLFLNDTTNDQKNIVSMLNNWDTY